MKWTTVRWLWWKGATSAFITFCFSQVTGLLTLHQVSFTFTMFLCRMLYYIFSASDHHDTVQKGVSFSCAFPSCCSNKCAGWMVVIWECSSVSLCRYVTGPFTFVISKMCFEEHDSGNLKLGHVIFVLLNLNLSSKWDMLYPFLCNIQEIIQITSYMLGGSQGFTLLKWNDDYHDSNN